MVISCLTAYAIALSCVTLLIGRSCAATPSQMDTVARYKSMDESKTSEKSTEIEVRGSEGSKVLQTAYSPSKQIEGVGFTNESHSFFASYDPVSKVTRKLKSSGAGRKPGKGRKEEHPWKDKIQNFVASDTLQDSEREVRIHYNGITAKETVVKTGIDEETGKRQGLKLRQLTDGTNFIQLIYTFDDQIQDCEYIRQRKVVDKFLRSFKEDVEKAKITYEIENEEGGGQDRNVFEDENDYDYDGDDDDDDYMEEDEGGVERYWRTNERGSDEFEGENVDMENEYQNVTFQIVRREEDLPGDVADWMNYKMLKRKCKENHRVLKQLVYDKRHGDENVKKMAEEHIERMKRGIEFTLIFPGTKWCGKSHVADKYTELGGFSRTDKCCRAHDHCHPLISAFEERYGFYNFRPFTISHCRCDRRRKRDLRDVFIVPGTKWCGKGRRATKYTSLGGFSRTDKCCRVHDTMCPHWIGSLEEKYGLFNWRINTIMHCRCDKRKSTTRYREFNKHFHGCLACVTPMIRFRACLKMAKTGTANFVGKLFFNVVQTKCFVLKPEEACIKYSWWRKCEKKEYRKKAYLKDNLSY